MRRPSAPQNADLNIRDMVMEDLDAVMELQRVSFKNPWSTELFKRELTHDWSTILLAEEPAGEGRQSLLAFLIFWIVHDEVHVLNVATQPHARNRGIARTLIEQALAKGRKAGCTLATLEVRRSNEAAIALYKSFNFRPVGVRPNYYADEGEDAIVMVLDL